MIDRRGFLALSAMGAVAGVAGACSTRPESATSGPATAPVVVDMTARETDVDLGGVAVRTWTYTRTS
jgi:hypothetical protein